MTRYDLDKAKNEVERLLSDIDRSMDSIKLYSKAVGLGGSSTGNFISEIKNNIYNYHALFMTAYGNARRKLDE